MATFIPRRWQALTQDMIDWLTANPDTSDGVLATDFFVGSLERSHLEAVAIQHEGYEIRTSQAIRWAISESAFHAFGFDLLLATSSTGSVQFICVQAPTSVISIPIGTKLIADGGQQFVTTTVGTIAIGAYLSNVVAVVAVTPGLAGRVPPGAIRNIPYAIAGVDGVSNLYATIGGSEIEDDKSRLKRFQRFVSTLVRGTTYSIEYALLNTGLVAGAKVIEPWTLVPPPPGTPYSGVFYCYIDDGIGGATLVPSVATAVNQIIYGYMVGPNDRVPGWKAAGVKTQIFPVLRPGVKVRGTVKLPPTAVIRWDAIQAKLTAAAQAYFATLGIADTVSYNDLLIALSLCDDDLVSVGPTFWLGDSIRPAYGTINAVDLVVSTTDTAASYGARAVLFEGPSTEYGGSTINYPEWVLV